MARTRAAQLWSSSASATSSEDEDHQMRADSEYESSEFSELDNDSDYMPDSEDEARKEPEDNFESYKFEVRMTTVMIVAA